VRVVVGEDLEDLRRPPWVGTVVEGQRDGVLGQSAGALLAAGGVDDRAAAADGQRHARLVADLGLDVVAGELGVDVRLHHQDAGEQAEHQRGDHDPGAGQQPAARPAAVPRAGSAGHAAVPVRPAPAGSASAGSAAGTAGACVGAATVSPPAPLLNPPLFVFGAAGPPPPAPLLPLPLPLPVPLPRSVPVGGCGGTGVGGAVVGSGVVLVDGAAEGDGLVVDSTGREVVGPGVGEVAGGAAGVRVGVAMVRGATARSRANGTSRRGSASVMNRSFGGVLTDGSGAGLGRPSTSSRRSGRLGSGRIALELTGPPARLTLIRPP
jgi:hypothetical protein